MTDRNQGNDRDHGQQNQQGQKNIDQQQNRQNQQQVDKDGANKGNNADRNPAEHEQRDQDI